MRRAMIGIFTAAICCGGAGAESGLPAIGSDGDPMRAYYGNTYTCYWPGSWECHHWWNADGSEVFFVMQWMPEGVIMLSTIEAPHANWIANGQWCSHNARSAVGEVNAMAERTRNPDAPIRKPNLQSLNNNQNGCQPIVDATPGDHWVKLHLSGQQTDFREQYTLMPGHQ